MAWAILPWIFHFLLRLKKEKSAKIFTKVFWQLFLVFVLFFLAHNIYALFGSALIIVFLLFYFKKDFAKWRKFLLIFFFSFLSCLWFWLPALMEKNLITMDNVDLSKNFAKHFPTLLQLFNPQLSFGYSYWGAVDSLSFSLGMVQIVILFLSLIYLLKNLKKTSNRNSKQIFIYLILSIFLILFQLPFTSFLYQIIPFANFIQFPWRLTLLLVVLLVPLSAFIFDHLKKSGKLFLSFLLILQMLQFSQLKPVDYFNKTKADYEFFPETTSVNHENLPKTFVYKDFYRWQPSAEIVEGQGTVQVNNWQGSKRSYQLNLSSQSLIIEPTAYFPGWVSRFKNLDNNDDNWQKIVYVDNELIAGRLAYRLPAGDYLVESRFSQKTWPRLIGNAVSLLTFLTLLVFYFFAQQRAKSNKKR
jgi:hypothetical protein